MKGTAKLNGAFEICLSCNKANAKRKKINKKDYNEDKLPGEHIAFDITGCSKQGFGKKKFA